MSRMQGERESIMVQDSQVLSGEGLAYLRRVRQGCERMYDSQQLCRQDLCFPVQNSDRAACIRYIRENGEDAFAEKMAKDQQMTMKRE